MYTFLKNNPHSPRSRVSPHPRIGLALNPHINTRLSGHTSDHAYRLFSVDFKPDAAEDGPPHFALKLGTWNLMMYARGPGVSRSHANNPLLVDEDDMEYIARKIFQFEELFTLLEKNRLDCFFLQEADFMFETPRDSLWLHCEKQNLQKYFLESLSKLGFGCLITSTKTVGDAGLHLQQPLMTLYRLATLNYSGAAPVGAFLKQHANGAQYRACMHGFSHVATKQGVLLVNAHLDYMTDYSVDNAINRLLSAQASKGLFTLMAGDANHSPGTHMDRLITDKRSSVVTAKTEPDTKCYTLSPKGYSVLSVQDGKGSETAFDGIFVFPPQKTHAHVRICGGKFITLSPDDSTATFHDIKPSLEPIYVTSSASVTHPMVHDYKKAPSKPGAPGGERRIIYIYRNK